MLHNPSIVPNVVGGTAIIKYGKAGGINTGTWWETGTKNDGDFHITQEEVYYLKKTEVV